MPRRPLTDAMMVKKKSRNMMTSLKYLNNLFNSTKNLINFFNYRKNRKNCKMRRLSKSSKPREGQQRRIILQTGSQMIKTDEAYSEK